LRIRAWIPPGLGPCATEEVGKGALSPGEDAQRRRRRKKIACSAPEQEKLWAIGGGKKKKPPKKKSGIIGGGRRGQQYIEAGAHFPLYFVATAGSSQPRNVETSAELAP